MPTVFDHQRNENLSDVEIQTYLADHGVHYEYWPVDAAPSELRHKAALTDAEKETLLTYFQDRIDRISEQFGYISHDLVVLNPDATPNLEELLANFERVHRHTEDEVRFIVDGEGIFTLTREGDTFSITVAAGDLISVPAGTEHYFTLTTRRNVKAVRLFQTHDGWVAIYKDESVETR